MTTKPRRKRGVLVAPPTSAGCGLWNEQRAVIPWAHIILVPSLRCTALGPMSAVLLLTILQVRSLRHLPRAANCLRNCSDLAVSGSNQAYRAISTSQLKALPLLHLWPIDVVVFHGSQGRPCFEGGFPLRCLQRLSCPNIATQHYRWHDNWSTSGSFTPVLSY